MISPSPEFPIVKLGMHHHRKRDKPLRTYGQRAATSTPGEPPAKRRKSTYDTPTTLHQSAKSIPDNYDQNLVKRSVQTSNHSADEKAEEKLSKGSILNYFQRQPQQVREKEDRIVDEEDGQKPADSPPAPIKLRRKEPRLLRIRAVILPPVESTEGGNTDEGYDESEKENQGTTGRNSSSITSLKQDGKDHSTDTAGAGALSSATRQRKRKRPDQTVQTTLNLSSAPAFSECKICNTVWNPLYPDDVRYHTKHHAAVVRNMKKG